MGYKVLAVTETLTSGECRLVGRVPTRMAQGVGLDNVVEGIVEED